MHAALLAYVLSAMYAWLPPHVHQRVEYRTIATAIVTATDDPEDAVQLASIGSFESGFVITARNPRSGARGVWQLLGRQRGDLRVIGSGLAGEAREALRRWKGQGMCGYTGEALSAPDCPLASARYFRAFEWSYAHPFISHAPPAVFSYNP